MPRSRSLRVFAFSLLLCAPAAAQFEYTVDIDLGGEAWLVEGTFPNPGGGDVDYWFARWTPGAYHTADFGRFVDELSATDGAGASLSVERLDDSHFAIAADGAETIRVAYVAMSLSSGLLSHGAVIDVESNRIRSDYAYLTPVSVFGFVKDRMDEPFTLAVDLPDGWKAATVLRQDDAGVYHAESFHRFEDSPFLFSPTLTTVETEAGGKPLTISVHGLEGAAIDELVDGCRRISEAGIQLMGGAPYDRYHYLFGFVPEGHGSGLEHSYSTLILQPQYAPPASAWKVTAHEFFHLWCAERVHVQGIREVDYTVPFVTGTIWVNECMTEYMTQHVLLHAGLLDLDGFFKAIGPSPLIAQMASAFGSPTAISRAAVGWESMVDLSTFSMKMYAHGPRLMLALDMEMRRLSNGERGVVDFLRHVMAEYDAKGRGFSEDGVLAILEEVAGGSLAEFYSSFIESNGNPDLDSYLDVIGYEVVGTKVGPIADPSSAQEKALEDFLAAEAPAH